MFRSIREFGARYIDYRMAWLGAGFMGFIVFLVNLTHGPAGALVAAGKQAFYTFFFAGLITRAAENLAVRYTNRRTSLTLACVLPSLLAVGFTYLLHSLKGTPEPFLSTVPTIVLAPPGFIWWGRKKRNAWEREARRSGKGVTP